MTDWKEKYYVGSKWIEEGDVKNIHEVVKHDDDRIYVLVYEKGEKCANDWGIYFESGATAFLKPHKEPEQITAYVHVLENGCFHGSYSKMETFAHYRVVARKKITIRVGELDD